MTLPTEALLTPEAVAAMLGVHPRSLRRLAAAGELPVVDLGQRTLRFRPQDVERFIEHHTRRTSRTAAREEA